MSLYTQQLAALDKHRGKGKQKITVEWVQVASGGQAFVGNAHSVAERPEAAPPTPAALKVPREDTVPVPSMNRHREQASDADGSCASA